MHENIIDYDEICKYYVFKKKQEKIEKIVELTQRLKIAITGHFRGFFFK